ncbi:bacteriocin-like protein [Chryseobacterium ginsengisoli]|uniref:bacteriocin-like protein n=1 Tax=Chryseobacterium ginsengisoli TaxID=363853 RepID=UPI0031ED5EFB
MKNLKKINRNELKNVMGGALPPKNCPPCEIYCSLPEGDRPSCFEINIVAHCNSCKDYPEAS